ncbi:MAG: class I SAM-dependent methyltransferase [Actinomycetota bacterium]
MSNATAEAPYGEAYYRDVCGQRPTRFDRARDDRVVRLVEGHAPPRRPDSSLLDIGCGYGHLLARFEGRFRLAGIDLSSHAASVAKERIPDASIITADLQRPFPLKESFDVVLAISVIEHLSDPVAGIAAIHNALLPGGLCVVHLPTVNGPMSSLIYRLAYASDPTHVYRPSGKDVVKLFAYAGFETLEESYSPHRRWLGSGVGWHPAYLAAFRRS